MYHCHVPPVPKTPPDNVIVEEAPEQIFAGFEEADVAADDCVFNVTVVFTHAVVLQSPSALT